MAHNAHHEHHPGMWVFPRSENISHDVTAKTQAVPQKFRTALVVTGILFALGVIGFIAKAATAGFDSHAPWGYYVAIFSFIFMITGSAPLAAVAFRITKNHWRRPFSRVSELYSVVGLLSIVMFIPMMLILPPLQDPVSGVVRRSIWFTAPIGSPHWWDALGVIFLVLLGLAILWLSATPDMSQARWTATGFRRSFYTALAGHWYGTKRQWTIQKGGLAILGALYFIFLVYVQFIISTDYGQSMVPGWKDSIYPPFYTLTSFQASLGIILVTCFIMKRWGGYNDYIGVSTFWSSSKVLLGLTLLWGYHLFTFIMIFWYGRLPVEQYILRYLFFEAYGGVFGANVFFSFLAPFLLLIWNPVRRSDWGPMLAGLFAVFGAFLFNMRTFVGAMNAGDVYAAFLDHVPPAVFPDLWDLLIVVGSLGAAAFIYLAATRLIPMMSMWEMKEGVMYTKMGNLFRGRYLVIAKPE